MSCPVIHLICESNVAGKTAHALKLTAETRSVYFSIEASMKAGLTVYNGV